MAALDDSPSRCQGQPWSVWADRMGFSEKPGENQEEDVGKTGREGDAMKLRKEDMALFGFCPAQDDFYLVVCGVCEQVVKPQALQSHMELRHREDAQRSHKGSSQKQHVETQQTEAPAPSSSSSSSSASHSQQPEKDRHPSPSTASLNAATTTNSSTCSPTTSSSSVPPQTNSSGGNNTRAKNPVLNAQLARHCGNSPHHARAAAASSARTLSQGLPQVCAQQQQHGRKANGNHPSNPVVRVERMPHNLMPRKERGQKREVPSPEQPPPPDSSAQAVTLSQGVTAGTILANGNHVVQQAIVAVAAAKKAAAIGGGGGGAEGRTRPASKSKSKTPSERKLLPCKDRVYDADKHCGVWIADIAKQCTRSLTCKTHSLAMRRNVSGRKKNFDELLADHRAAKEAEAAAKAAQVVVVSGLDAAIAQCCPLPSAAAAGPAANPNSRAAQKCGPDAKRPNCSSAAAEDAASSSSRRKQTFSREPHGKAGCLAPPNNHKLLPSSSSSSSSAKSKVANASNKSALTPSTQLRPSPAIANPTAAPAPVPAPQEPVPKTVVPLDAGAGCAAADQVARARQPQPQRRKERCFVTHHPRPAAVCAFNARQMGAGFFVCDRRLDAARTALRAALGERHPLTPPIKKLCVESRLPPVPEPSDPSDPYSFACNDHVTAAKCSPSSAQVSSAAVAVCSPAPLPPPRPVSLPVPLLATCPPVPLSFASPTTHHHHRTSSSPSAPTCPSPRPVKKVASRTRTNSEAPSSGAKRKRPCDSAPPCPGPVLVPGAGPNNNNVLSVSFPVNLGMGMPPARTQQHAGPFGDVNLLVTNVGVVNGQLMTTTPQGGKAMTGFGCRQDRRAHGFPCGPAAAAVSALLTGPRKGKGASSRSTRAGPRVGPAAVTMAVLGGGMGALSNVGLVGGVTHANNHATQVSPSSAKGPSPVTRSGCASPQVLTNGLGPSPPPPPVFLKGASNFNHVNRTGSPDLPSPSSEGKTCGSRQDAVAASKGPQGGPRMAPRLGSQLQTHRASVNASAATTDSPASARSHACTGSRQGSNNAAAAVNHHSQQAASKRTSRPVPTKMVSGSSSPMQLLAKPFLLQNEDIRRQEMHGSQSLPT